MISPVLRYSNAGAEQKPLTFPSASCWKVSSETRMVTFGFDLAAPLYTVPVVFKSMDQVASLPSAFFTCISNIPFV